MGVPGFRPAAPGCAARGAGAALALSRLALAQLDYSAFIHIGRQVLLYASSFFDVVSVGHTI